MFILIVLKTTTFQHAKNNTPSYLLCNNKLTKKQQKIAMLTGLPDGFDYLVDDLLFICNITSLEYLNLSY